MLLLRRARVPVSLLPASLAQISVDPIDPTLLCDVRIEGDVILSVEASQPGKSGWATTVALDLDGAMVFPGFVDAHTHLDKTHTWFRAPNRSGTFGEALETLGRDKAFWTPEDLLFRGDFALRSAYAHGTRVLRTHVDTGLPWAETSHAIMQTLRERWRDRIELQTVPLCGMDAFAGTDGEKIADLALRYGASALGGFALKSDGLAPKLDRLMAIARERGVGLDLHVDETGDPEAECLRAVAEAVLRNAFPHQVVCGHCCSLAMQPPDRQRSTIDLVKAAKVAVISLPLCNLYLQDRRAAGAFPLTPAWRGVTLIRDLMAAGVPVACASDNVRDAFFAYGDYDMAEVYARSVRTAHLDADLRSSVTVATSTAAYIVGRPEFGQVVPGSQASLVIFDAHSFSELLSRPATCRRRVDGERVHAPRAPDYSELRTRITAR